MKKFGRILLTLLFVCSFADNRLYAPFGPDYNGYVKNSGVTLFKSIAIDPNSNNLNNIIAVGETTGDQGCITYYVSNGESSITSNLNFLSAGSSILNKVITDGTSGSNTYVLCAGTTTTSGVSSPFIGRYVLNTTEANPTLDATVFNNAGYCRPALGVTNVANSLATGTINSQKNSIIVGEEAGAGAIISMIVNSSATLNTNFNTTGSLIPVGQDGALDTTFNSAGTNQGYTNTLENSFTGVTIDSTGNILCAASNGTIVRYLATGASAGTLDTSFGSSGVLTIGYGNINAVTIDSSHNIVAVGNYNGYGELWVYNAAGTSNLKAFSDHSSSNYYGVVVDGSGRVIVVGTTGTEGVIVRYTSGYSVDTSFGTSGYAYPTGSLYLYGVALVGSESGTPNEEIIAVGQSTDYAYITRYYNDYSGQLPGTMDMNFNNPGGDYTGGPGYYSDESATVYMGVATDSSGRSVAVGHEGAEPYIIRYSTAGVPDGTTFPPYETGQLNQGSYNAVTIDSQGSIVVVGTTNVFSFIGRYLSTGPFDTAFGGQGYGYVYDDEIFQYNAVTLLEGSNYIIGAGISNGSGRASRHLGYGVPLFNTFNDVIYDSGRTNDYIVAVGASPYDVNAIISSFTTSGATGSFNGTPPPGITTGELYSISMATINSSTVYVVAGTDGNNTSGYVGVINQNGTTYTSFNGGAAGGAGGGSGYVTGAADGSTVYYKAIIATINSTQCVVAVGTTGTKGVISVFTLSGAFYTEFNTNGYVVSPASSSANAAIFYDVYVDSNGNVVVVGTTSDMTPQGIIARYLPNGSLDATQTTNTIAQLVADFNITTLPFFNSTTGLLSLTATTITGQEGTALQDITNFTSEVAGTFTAHTVNIDEVTTIDLSGNQIATLPTGAFNGTTFTNLTTVTIDNNTVALTVDSEPFQNFNGAYNSDLTVSINNDGITTLPTQLFSNTTTIGGLDLSNNGLTSVPSTLLTGITNIHGNVLLEGNTGLTAISEGLFAGIVSTGNLNVSSLPLTQFSLQNATFEGTVNASGTDVSGVNDTALSNATIGTLNLNNSQVAAGNISLFSMDTANITTITLSGAPVVGAAPANIQTQLNNGISSAALGNFLHSRQSRDIITPIGYAGITDHYQSLNKPTGF